jgi:hypothetical protein
MISTFHEHLKALGALLNIYDTILRTYLFIGKLTRPFKNMNKEGTVNMYKTVSTAKASPGKSLSHFLFGNI